MNLFFDTSALVKYFHQEAGSQDVAALIDQADNQIWVSDLARIEFLSVLYRKIREAALDSAGLEEAMVGFEEEWKRFHVQPLGHVVVAEAERLLQACGGEFRLRTLDALQFASFSLIAETDWSFVVADATLAATVTSQGYSVLQIGLPV